MAVAPAIGNAGACAESERVVVSAGGKDDAAFVVWSVAQRAPLCGKKRKCVALCFLALGLSLVAKYELIFVS